MLTKLPPGASNYCVTSPVYVIPKKEPGRFRIILDLRYVNSFQNVPHFRMEGFPTVMTLLQAGDHMCKLDILSAFYHVEAARDARRFVCFAYGGTIYQYNVLSMGSSSSPYFLQKVLRPVIQELRMEGIRLTIYVDDILIMASSKEACIKDTSRVAQLLVELGFHLNVPKCEIVPSQQRVFLGLELDTSGPQPRIKVPAKKKHALLHEVQRFHRKAEEGPVPKRHLARVIGLMTSVTRALSATGMLCRALIGCLSQKKEWNAQVQLTRNALQDLRLWQEMLLYWNGQTILPPPVDLCLNTDASNLGWGAVLSTSPSKTRINDGWTRSEQPLHINAKELLAVEHSCRRLGPLLSNKVIRLQMDNTVGVAYLRKWTGKVLELREITRRVFDLCQRWSITLLPEYLPGKFNTEADYESRNPDHGHWVLKKSIFRHLCHLWGTPTIDRFALPSNCQVPRFNSRNYCPEAEAVDGLAQHWSNEHNFVNPPFALMEQVVQHLMTHRKVVATVVAPQWEAQAWYHRLIGLSDEVYLLPTDSVQWTGTGISTRELSAASWRLVACKISLPQRSRAPKWLTS